MIQKWILSDRDSSIFTAMKTIAMLMVLVIHADLRSHGAEQSSVTDFYNELFSNIFATAAVPIFSLFRDSLCLGISILRKSSSLELGQYTFHISFGVHGDYVYCLFYRDW